VGQAVCAIAALGILVWITRRVRDGQAAIAAMAAATGFCVPFLGEYDMLILAIPVAWLLAEGQRSGWLPFERANLIALYLAPLAVRGVLLSVVRRVAQPYDPG
jgi:hypothetical protein